MDAVFAMTEHSLECNAQLDMLLDRLKMLEQIHLQSPNLTHQISKIKQVAAQQLSDALAKEAALIKETGEATEKAVCEI